MMAVEYDERPAVHDHRLPQLAVPLDLRLQRPKPGGVNLLMLKKPLHLYQAECELHHGSPAPPSGGCPRSRLWEAGQRPVDLRLRMIIVLELTGEVGLIGPEIEMPVPAQPEEDGR